MSRSRLAAVTALAALVAAAPSSAAATRAPAKKPGVGAVASRSFAVLRRAPRPSDDVLRAVGAATRKLPHGAIARRVAHGTGYAAFLVAGARVTPGVHATKQLQLVLVQGGKATGFAMAAAAAAHDGFGVVGRRSDGSYRLVAVLPDGATRATTRSGGVTRALRIRGNAVVAVLDAPAAVSFTAADGLERDAPVSGDTPHSQLDPVLANVVHATLLDGSRVTLGLPGGVTRDVPLSGTVEGEIPAGYQLGEDNTINLTAADLHVGAADLLTDDCAGPPLARLDPATGVTLDPSASTVTIGRKGAVSATASVALRTVLDVRGDHGCGGPAATSGYADTSALTFSLSGAIAAPGNSLNHLELTSAATPVTVNGCLTAGDPARPCAQAPAAVSGTATLSLVVRVDIRVGT